MLTSMIVASTMISGGSVSDSPWAQMRSEMEIKWPKNREVRILCHGHSVPGGYFTGGNIETFNSYPHLFHVALNRRFPYSMIKVIPTAIGGENSVQGAKRFKRDVLSLKPDVITIDYSLNDRPLELKAVRAAWSSMVTEAKKAGVLVILLTPTPDTTENISDPQTKLSLHAQQVREIAAEFNVKLVDSYKQFVDLKNSGVDLKAYMSQNNHPNRKGHEIVAKELEKAFLSD